MHQVTPLLFAPPLGLDLLHRASVMQFVLYEGDINDFAVVHNYEVITKQSQSGGLDPRWSGNQLLISAGNGELAQVRALEERERERELQRIRRPTRK